jgi:hypothetical protein
MRHKSIIILLAAFWWATQLWGQNQPLPVFEFNPAVHPVAVDIDSTTVSTISDYVLIKALRGSMPSLDRIVRVSIERYQGTCYLVFETVPTGPSRTAVFVNMPLVRTPVGTYLITGSAQSCSGCNKCVGCKCEGSATTNCQPAPNSRVTALPLSKVSTAIELSSQ